MPRPVRVTSVNGVGIHKPAWQACPPVEEKPVYAYLQPAANTGTANAWQSNTIGSFSDFYLPNTFGNVVDGFLRLGVTFTGALPRCNLTPTTCWVDHFEIYLGTDLIETVYRTEIHDELMGFRRAQDASNIFFTHNLESNFTEVNDASGANVMPDGYYYLNFWEATCLKSWRPFVAGYSAPIFIRVYWAASIVTDSNPASVQNPSLFESTLIVEQAVMSDSEKAVALAYHQNPGNVMVTSVVRRERFQSAPQNIQANTTTQVQLTAFSGNYVGQLIYIVPSTQLSSAQANNDILLNKGSLQWIQLFDAGMQQITQPLFTGTLSAISWPGDLDSNFPTAADATVNSLFLLPWSSAFQGSVQNGCDYGKREFKGTEYLQVNPGAAGTAIGATQVIIVVGYRMGTITVQGGKHSLKWQ
jgi:hypothetical protein